MRIVLTGGGTGGHFYPLIAVAESIRKIAKEQKLLQPEIFFFGPNVFDERSLYDNDIVYVHTAAGKMRVYASIYNVIDLIKSAWGLLTTLSKLYRLYPDVIFSKGGYGAMPTLVAARILNIPVVIHDSDSVPGRATLYAAPFAKEIALSYDEALPLLPKSVQAKAAIIGNPIRADILVPAKEGAHEFLELENNVPVVVILGGSQGAQVLNDCILEALPELVNRYQVIHQTGNELFKTTDDTSKVILDKNERRYRYKPFAYLSPLATKMTAGVADIVVSRAGSGNIFEIASWGVASILVPIPEDVSRDQRSNAFAFARHGACIVIEQGNLAPHLLVSEIDRLFTNPKARTDMADAAKKFARPDAAHTLAERVLKIALEHTT